MVVDDALLTGAHRAIERWGYGQATMERIAAEAGVSRMTLHRRGVTRDGLLGALAERLEDAYRTAMWPALTARGTGRERLEQALAAYCGAVEANLEVLAALAEADHNAIFHEDGPRGLSRPGFTEPIRTRPRRSCSTSSAGPTATCAAATAGASSAPGMACCAWPSTGWQPVERR